MRGHCILVCGLGLASQPSGFFFAVTRSSQRLLRPDRFVHQIELEFFESAPQPVVTVLNLHRRREPEAGSCVQRHRSHQGNVKFLGDLWIGHKRIDNLIDASRFL